MANIISVPNLTKIPSFTTEIWPKIGNFNKSVILGPNDSCTANIYLQIKFGANQSRNCWYTCLCISKISDLFYPNFGLSQPFPLRG